MAKFMDLTGQVFGRLTVVRFYRRVNNVTKWVCHCGCGKDTIVDASNLRRDMTKSCGCTQATGAKKRRKRLSPDLQRLLGTMSDQMVADESGLALNTIVRLRIELGIPPFRSGNYAGRTEDQEERRQRAIQMWSDGKTYNEIGAELGIEDSSAHSLVHGTWSRTPGSPRMESDTGGVRYIRPEVEI